MLCHFASTHPGRIEPVLQLRVGRGGVAFGEWGGGDRRSVVLQLNVSLVFQQMLCVCMAEML